MKENQLRVGLGPGLKHPIKPRKRIVVPFRRREIRSHEVGQQLMRSRLPVPPVVRLREQNKRIAEVLGTFAK
jgi:hypothetical protein